MPDSEGRQYGYELPSGHPPQYWQKAKDDAWQRDHAWECGFALMPNHPQVTGEKKCWLCLKESSEKSMTFDVETRLGDWVHMSPDELQAIRDKGKDPAKEVPNKVKTCEFCDLKCYMEGWPAVRRDFILAGGRAKPKDE